MTRKHVDWRQLKLPQILLDLLPQDLQPLCRRAQSGDPVAQRQLLAFVQKHPDLIAVLRASVKDDHPRRKVAKLRGHNKTIKREFVSWVKAGREGAKYVVMVHGGAPSLGKRR